MTERDELASLVEALRFAERIHAANTGAPGKYGAAADAITRLTEERDQRDAVIASALEAGRLPLGKQMHRVIDAMILELRKAPADALAERDAEKNAEGAAEERREWAGYIETSLAHVMPPGTPPLTAERIAVLLRGPRPFGIAAAQQGENNAN